MAWGCAHSREGAKSLVSCPPTSSLPSVPPFERQGVLKSCQNVFLKAGEPLVARVSLLGEFWGGGGGLVHSAARKAAEGPLSMDFSPRSSSRRRALAP